MTLKILQVLAASLLSCASVLVATPVLADTVDASCDVFTAGDDKATSSGLCTFSQRQGFVTIRLKGGQTYALKPNASPPMRSLMSKASPPSARCWKPIVDRFTA
ncbi:MULTISPECIES: hypothetical protein [unclassified Cyanobium]|uniref:hypothetical protein n=1 Tax=unclassified Cyanobium TaxID=2627006 RepID=UPI0020CE18A5|nr:MULTISPECIES: hypothetical protein [unclassified Cyanobium]MCP9835734.1 hypothetical protein [Cyanobium sp. La Preciosa 7G6]MCP9938508.1 hypothetical protein [Cyanobium sp. Aljojuca 7A6]